jgi:hypothetical protein
LSVKDAIGAAVTRVVWSVAEQSVSALRWVKIFETISHKDRLGRNGLKAGDLAPVAQLRLRHECQNPRCGRHVSARWLGLRGFSRDPEVSSVHARLRPFAAMVPLGEFSSMADYVNHVSRISDGNDRREVARARKLGYSTRRIGAHSHPVSLDEIVRSKPVRSGGVMAKAIDAPAPAERHADFVDQVTPIIPPRCAEHWQIDFGVFRDSDPDRMMAKATLGRSGNLVEIVFFMGHGAALRDGVMKVLMFDIMQWLLESNDPLIEGVDFLSYGAVEEGADGRDKWRRYLGFRPFAIAAERPRDHDWLPEGFDIAAYLALNPDLKAARVLPITHFRLNGAFEERAYSFEQPAPPRLSEVKAAHATAKLALARVQKR